MIASEVRAFAWCRELLCKVSIYIATCPLCKTLDQSYVCVGGWGGGGEGGRLEGV